MVRLVTHCRLPVYASGKAIQTISQEFHYMLDVLDLREISPYETFDIDGISYTAVPVVHAPGTYGYLIQSPHAKAFYACDTAPLPKETIDYLKGVDILAIDGTYWKENGSPNAHHSIQQSIQTARAMEAKQTYLTHLAMHYSEPITLRQLQDYLAQYGGTILPASDGLVLDI